MVPNEGAPWNLARLHNSEPIPPLNSGTFVVAVRHVALNRFVTRKQRTAPGIVGEPSPNYIHI